MLSKLTLTFTICVHAKKDIKSELEFNYLLLPDLVLYVNLANLQPARAPLKLHIFLHN